MQTILGAGGVIGNGLARMLKEYTSQIRLVSRNPKVVNPTDEIYPADLTNTSHLTNAVQGSEIVYLTVGLPYKLDIWEKYWQQIMADTISACIKYNAKLVFFDNVYAYGKVDGWMKEESPFNPCSKKGEIRAKVATMLLEVIHRGQVQGLIARAADFYGPNAANGIPNILVIDRLKAGKRAFWLVNAKRKHSITFVPDAVKAAVILGNTADAYGQTWHLPTDKNALTGKGFIELCGNSLGVKPHYMVLKPWMLKLAGLFDATLKELNEMGYQQEYDYLFDSSKFETRFFKPTSYEEGIKLTIQNGKI